MPITTWSHPMWFVIHNWSFGYPIEPLESDRRVTADYYNNLPNLIPCADCAIHFSEILQSDPVEANLDNRGDLVEWTWRIHNAVNNRIGKPTFSMDAFCDKYGIQVQDDQPVAPIMSRAIGKLTQTVYGILYRV